jgi:hypothetical protein
VPAATVYWAANWTMVGSCSTGFSSPVRIFSRRSSAHDSRPTDRRVQALFARPPAGMISSRVP